MDTVKYYISLVDPHWLAVVATGLYTHLRQICIIGLCFENETKLPFDQSYASVLFVFSVLCLLAEYRLWPVTLKEPPIQVLYIYEVSVRGDHYSLCSLRASFTETYLDRVCSSLREKSI